MMSFPRMTLLPQSLNRLLWSSFLMVCLLPGCAKTMEALDTGWRVADPSGHRRYHRDRYYKHERKIGIKVPGDAGF